MLPHHASISATAEAVLSKAESYARRALEGIASLRAERSISLENWQRQTGQMKATAHSALGLIALNRGQHSTSIAEFETCISQNPSADGAQYYMLGLAYRLNGNAAHAATAFRRASELGPDLVRARAQKELAATW
jgi:tetratricopeptide (TPR) repeat protein